MWSFCDLQQARVQEVSSTVHHHGVDIVIRNVPLIEMWLWFSGLGDTTPQDNC